MGVELKKNKGKMKTRILSETNCHQLPSLPLPATRTPFQMTGEQAGDRSQNHEVCLYMLFSFKITWNFGRHFLSAASNHGQAWW
jgi:hypothetical protein